MSGLVTVLLVTVPLVTAGAAAATLPDGGEPLRRPRPASSSGGRAPTSGATPEWAGFLDAAASGVRAGLSLSAAIQQASERTGVEPARNGSPHSGLPHHHRDRARRRRVRRGTDADEAVVQQALQVAAELGGPVASGLQHAADLLRERDSSRAEARAHAAAARLSALVLTVVPIAFAVFGALTSASYRQAVDGGLGVVLATAGALLNLSGWRWMQRTIIRATT